MYNGVINLNKPKGKTSHDMIYFVRRLFAQKRVGHTGTLDPNATGVLPVCLGIATKAADYIAAHTKVYEAQIIFGIETDTCDICGEVKKRNDGFILSEEELLKALKSFVGEISQIPPMYSAIKVDGKKLYELARKGIEIERKERKVFIYDISLKSFSGNEAVIVVTCSKGTYIRTLCEDIGRKTGALACMGDLKRIKSGSFSINESYTCEELERMAEEGTLSQAVIKTDEFFKDYEKIVVSGKNEFKVRNGAALDGFEYPEDTNFRIYSEDGEFLCVSQMSAGRIVMLTSFWDTGRK